mmetsp:Transcript_5113/g.13053  ORF Transcript_5113/g.13053 Transcript_5113/m.13053 type:complete len:241 (+) Transcript_5113:622-1344(+)
MRWSSCATCAARRACAASERGSKPLTRERTSVVMEETAAAEGCSPSERRRKGTSPSPSLKSYVCSVKLTLSPGTYSQRSTEERRHASACPSSLGSRRPEKTGGCSASRCCSPLGVRKRSAAAMLKAMKTEGVSPALSVAPTEGMRRMPSFVVAFWLTKKQSRPKCGCCSRAIHSLKVGVTAGRGRPSSVVRWTMSHSKRCSRYGRMGLPGSVHWSVVSCWLSAITYTMAVCNPLAMRSFS